VVLVLVISAANLLNLVLTRLTLRQGEFLTRVALGADRGRLLRQLLSEGLCLYALSGVAGLLLSVFFLRLAPIILNDLPYIERVSFSFPTLVLTLVLTLAFALVVALVPAGAVLRKIGGHHAFLSGRVTVSDRRLRKVLVLVELGLALVAFIGSAMLLKSLAQIQNEDLGFSTENVLMMQVVLPQWKHNEEIPWISFFDEFEERLADFPDVESVGVAEIAPFSEHNASIVAAGDRALLPTPEMATASYNVVSEGYFHTLDIPLIEGRLFDQRDSNRAESERVVVISESLARYLWPERSSIGKRFSFEFLGTAESPEPHWRRIIGVVGDARDESLGAPPGFAAYASYGQRPIYLEGAESPPMILMIETGEPSATLLDRVRAEIRALDPSLPIKNVQTLAEVMDATLRERRVVTYLLSCFAGIAFILALIGLYGVTSYTLETMRQEIGVRMALGAAPRRILGELLRESLTTILIGVALGLLAAVSLPSVLSKWLYGVRPIEPSLFLLGALTVAVVALLATLAPALRASRLTIVEVLRHE
jgi:putative ABC transport system permease protein